MHRSRLIFSVFVAAGSAGEDRSNAPERDRVKELQRVIHKLLPREAAPPGLRARIEASVGGLRNGYTCPLASRLYALTRTFEQDS
jgi:hypothetical protein